VVEPHDLAHFRVGSIATEMYFPHHVRFSLHSDRTADIGGVSNVPRPDSPVVKARARLVVHVRQQDVTKMPLAEQQRAQGTGSITL
jgi:hypothetical protein